MPKPPSGTVTFLFTDIEGSTRKWQDDPDEMRALLAQHDEVLRLVIDKHRGHVFKHTGDGVAAAFASAADAAAAAVDAQGQLGDVLPVRIGLHSGEAELRDGDYYGTAVNRAARIMSVAHGGQIVCSQPTADLARDVLGDRVALGDLGVHRLRDLTNLERIFQVGAPGLAREFPPLRSLDTMPGNLPRQVTTFVGRETEIGALAVLVRESSLVTLTGVGGVGKTRLALQVAAEVVPEFVDGACFCEFAPVADGGAVWEALAASLRVQPFPGRSLEESALDYLAAKHLLLVLDNCEHLLGAIARLVAAIVQRCPEVCVLATSREGLGLGGERMIAVPSLGMPADDARVDDLLQADAVRLFADRAAAANSAFALDIRNVGAVGVLCRRLDGIPLAIELAAARVRSMSPEDLVDRLDQRFRLLTKGSRAALERQQTLRATIDWSYDLLDTVERAALSRLSVFAGGWVLAAAEAVLAGDDLDIFEVDEVLGQLVDKSLVVADETDGGGVRYRLLETIRQYAQQRLEASGDTAPVRRRHADYFVGVAEAAGPGLRSRGRLEWADGVARDTDNFRAALDWGVEAPSADHALRLVAPLAVHGAVIGDAAMDWAATALSIPGGDGHRLFPVAAAWAAWGATFGGDFARAENFAAAAQRAQEAIGARYPEVARACAILALFRGDREWARHYAEEWVELARASGDAYELAHSLVLLGAALLSTPHELDAVAHLEESIRLGREAGIETALPMGLVALAGLFTIGDPERALALFDEAIDIGTRVGERMAVATATAFKGALSARRGDWAAALRAAVDAATRQLQLGDLVGLKGSFAVALRAFWGLKRAEPAAVLIGKVDAMEGEVASQPGFNSELSAATSAVRENLGEQRAAELAALGAALEYADTVVYVRVEADRTLRNELLP